MNVPDSAFMKKVRQWISYGNADLRMANLGFALGENAPLHLIAYHAQQSVEKYLKAYLVFYVDIVVNTTQIIRSVLLKKGVDFTEDIPKR